MDIFETINLSGVSQAIRPCIANWKPVNGSIDLILFFFSECNLILLLLLLSFLDATSLSIKLYCNLTSALSSPWATENRNCSGKNQMHCRLWMNDATICTLNPSIVEFVLNWFSMQSFSPICVLRASMISLVNEMPRSPLRVVNFLN